MNQNSSLTKDACNTCIAPQKPNANQNHFDGLVGLAGLVEREVEKQLASLHLTNNHLLNSRSFMTAKEASVFLKTSHLTILEYCKSGQLIACKFGNQYRIENCDMEDFISRNKKFSGVISIKTKSKAV